MASQGNGLGGLGARDVKLQCLELVKLGCGEGPGFKPTLIQAGKRNLAGPLQALMMADMAVLSGIWPRLWVQCKRRWQESHWGWIALQMVRPCHVKLR